MNPQSPPSGPPQKSGPSCWTIGGVGCLIVLAVAFILFFVAWHSFMGSKSGAQFKSFIKTTIQGGEQAVACQGKLSDVYAAIMRYHAKNGKYPPSLAALTPDYLPDQTNCHCSLDSNPDPTHQTFVYTPPTSASRPADRLISFVWSEKMTILDQTETVHSTYYYAVNGKSMVQQSVIDDHGHVTSKPPMENNAPIGPSGGG